MKLLAFFLLLLCIIPVNSVSASNSNSTNNSKISQLNSINPTQLANDYSTLIEIYTNGLLHQAQLDGNNTYSLKWKKVFNEPGNSTTISQYYFGLYYGAAGIGTTFLDLYANTKNQTYLDVAEKAGNYLITSAKTSKYGYGWFRSEDSVALYSSEKYGLAGIATFLIYLYQESSNKTFLNYAESTLNLLYNTKQYTEYGFSWDYRLPESTAITDYIYGVTGIAKSFLKAYEATNNKTYLTISINATSWVMNQSEYTSLDQTGLRRVLYSQDPSYFEYFTGYQSGAAGIGDFLLELYNKTNNEDYLLYAKQLANWLVYKEDGKGYWSDYNAVDYLTDQNTINSEGTFLGYSAGSSGAGTYFMDLYRVTQDSKYLGPVIRVKDFLLNNIQTNGTQIYWKDQINGHYANRIETGLSLGVAGIGLFFTNYYSLFGGTDIINTLNGIKEFYTSITTNNGLVPYVINSSTVIYDSSYLEGLAGIVTFVLDAKMSLETNPLVESSVLSNIGTYDINTITTWTKCYEVACTNSVTSDVGYISILAILVIPVVRIIRKRRSSDK